MLSSIEQFLQILSDYDILLGLIFILAYQIFSKIATKALTTLARNKKVKPPRILFITRTVNILLFVFLFATFLLVSGIGYGNFSIFLSSVFTVLGVSFIAQWSILSNITASFLIFFVFPYRVGDNIRIDDGAGIEGMIIDIRLFHTLIKHEDGDFSTYPNNLLLQKNVTKRTHKNAVEPTLQKVTDVDIDVSVGVDDLQIQESRA
ncbi:MULTISPECIES: mechanosensitive ion channel domain-containing protein [Vibrio]|uniref:Small-conductance mechanosensitive channel n=2 Tax=Vibrio harveyi group TaxID=717610 RepID=A0AAU9QH93_9VIBR|nr:mechanosensitive ion channel family protein [Vibrio owensii]EKO3865021.1 mechanosensitive ion channel family protein [Vibrio harveyi]CAH1568296.1 Mechanosensitive ion channel protein MscS [Vibrio jasicida]AYO22371.1 mechanosensitive ion channel family protein [Vibrio owensii]KIF51658.1 mechanosensitive ion channel protein MscS [Vibrio owensii CAIM 1854 = LMG 25443]MCR9942128.1 mechanosensitive ion channel family protein [Vibrio owensii]